MSHDSTYKTIFSDTEAIAQLFRYIAAHHGGDVLNTLDFSTLERQYASFVSKGGRKRESDILWRVKSNGPEHEWIYLYLLLELQSSVDKTMALRAASYVTLIHLENVKIDKGADKLAPILPVVLYNGQDTWTAATNFADLQHETGFLSDYIVHSKYLLVDLTPVFELQDRQNLGDLEDKNLIEVIALAEHSPAERKELGNLIMKIRKYLTDHNLASLDSPMTRLLANRLSDLGMEDERLADLKSLKEVESMIEEVDRDILAKVKKNRAESEARGRLLARAEIVRSLLSEGMNIESIARVTKTSVEEVKKYLN